MAGRAQQKRKTKHPGDYVEGGFPCTQESCETSFDFISSFKRHLLRKHKFGKGAGQDEADMIQKIHFDMFGNWKPCPSESCQQKFKVVNSFKNHLKEKHGMKPNEVEEAVTEEKVVYDTLDNPIGCTLCEKSKKFSTARQSHLIRHMKQVHGTDHETARALVKIQLQEGLGKQIENEGMDQGNKDLDLGKEVENEGMDQGDKDQDQNLLENKGYASRYYDLYHILQINILLLF